MRMAVDDVVRWQVHYHCDEPHELVMAVDTDVDEIEADTQADERAVVLTRGREPAPEGRYADHPYVYQADSSRGLSRTIVRDEAPALGYYLHGLEMHGVAEHQAFEWLEEEASEWLSVYNDFQEKLEPRDRRLRLMDLLEWRVDEGEDWAAGKYLNELPCKWRSTNLSGDAAELASQIKRSIDPKPTMCYWTAQHAALLHKDNHRLRDRIKYVEGVVLPETAGQCIRHAWIEIDGDVAELTWPWHYPDGDGAVYFGVEFSLDEVAAAREERDIHGSLALNEDQLAVISGQKRGV